MKSEAKYVVVDGMDGCGKGTQMELLRKKFPSALFTREPGGPPFAEKIRKLVRDDPLASSATPLTHFLLFWAGREETQDKQVVPALVSGKHVFSDRGDSSTFGFQLLGETRMEFLDAFLDLRELVFSSYPGRRQPDLYIVLDLPPNVSRERALQDATRTQTHFDVRDLAFYERVRNGFHEFEKTFGRVRFVDATLAPEEVHRCIMAILAAEKIL